MMSFNLAGQPKWRKLPYKNVPFANIELTVAADKKSATWQIIGDPEGYIGISPEFIQEWTDELIIKPKGIDLLLRAEGYNPNQNVIFCKIMTEDSGT